MADIRCCNMCIDRPEPGAGMHWCQGCCRFVCTRKQCVRLHGKECKRALGDPYAAWQPRPPAEVIEMGTSYGSRPLRGESEASR
jgi:hypothetical protein